MIPYILTALGGYLIGSSVKQYASGGQVQLLAPNGKPSNLTPEQYKLVRTPEFKAWFGDWENDPENASKVVDENGEPLAVYRGNLFSQEELGYRFELGKNFLKKEKANQFGFFFTNKMDIAKKYMLVDHFDEIQGGSITSVFLSCNNLIDLRKLGLKTGQENLIKGLKDLGISFVGYEDLINKILNFNPEQYKGWGYYVFDYFDVFPDLRNLFIDNNINGILFLENSRSSFFYYDVFVIFQSNQIKLADGSNTTFDGSNPDIRYEEGGIVLEYLIHWTNRDGLEGIFKDKFLNEETSLTDSLKLPFDKENNMPFGIKLKNVPRKLLVKKGDTLLEKKHEYRTKRKLKIDEYFDGFVVRNNTNKNRLEKYLENSFAFWDNDILRKYFREHNNDYQIKIKN